MGWPRQTNYHGTREYEADRPSQRPVGQLRLTTAWLFETAKRWLEPVLRSTPADHVGFTRLGTADLHLPRRAATACAFPERDERSTRRSRGQ